MRSLSNVLVMHLAAWDFLPATTTFARLFIAQRRFFKAAFLDVSKWKTLPIMV